MSEETIRALAGHVSRKMLERYSHIRLAAKQVSIQSLETGSFETGSRQNPPQADADIAVSTLAITKNASTNLKEFNGGRTWT